MGLIKINMSQLREAAAKLEHERNAIASERAKIQALDSLRARWKHTDNNAFMLKISELEQDMLELEEIIQIYITTINTSATAYEKAHQDVLNISKIIRSSRR